jgi:hypothetical protein
VTTLPTRQARLWSILTIALVAAGCMTQPAPRPVAVTPPRPPVHAVAKLDWFQRQLVLAGAARRDHAPRTDLAGARQAYYRVALNACQGIDAHGLTKYRGRCNALMKDSLATVPTPPEATDCADGADDPDKITACND